jgi:hypothetical protein
VLFNPGQVNPLHEVPDGDNSLGRDRAAVDRRHVALDFALDVCGRALAPCGNRAKLMCDPLPFDVPARVPAFPIADVPTISNTNDLPVLFPVSH